MKCFIVGLVTLCHFATAPAQTVGSQEFFQNLEALSESISAASQPDNIDFARLEPANESLRTWLLTEGAKHPEWLQAGALHFEHGSVAVLTSADRRFRIYYWDTWTGGTMHFYAGVIQYLAAPGRAATVDLDDKKTMEDGGDPGHWYSAIHSVTTKNGKTFYLPIFHGTYSTRDLATGIRAYTIRGGKLQDDVPFFFTKTKQYNSISYRYDFFASGAEAIPQISVSKDGQDVLIPVVMKGGNVTDRVLRYRFNGEHFVYEPAK